MATINKKNGAGTTERQDEPKVVKLQTSMRRNRRAKAVWARVALVLTAMFICASIFMLNTEVFRVKVVEIKGSKRVSANDIYRLSGVDLGQNLLTVSTSSVAESLLQNPLIKKISIKRILPSKLRIDVYERQPIVYMKIGGRYFMIDDERYVLQVDRTRVQKTLKVISSDSVAAVDVGRRIEFPRQELLADFIGSADHKLGDNYKSIKFNRDGITLILKNGAYVQLGSGEDMEEKLRFIPLVLQSLEKGGHQFEGINLKTLAVPTFIPRLTPEEKERLRQEALLKQEVIDNASSPKKND